MNRGFSLLEVVVALAIMGLSLLAIFEMNSGAIRKHVYTKRLTVATLLARSKMIDIEQNLHDKGLSNDDEEDSGDFSDEGWKNFKWRAKILAPRTQGLSPDKLIAAIFNLPTGEGGQGGLGALFGGAVPGNLPQAGNTQGGMLGALGPMSGLVQGQFTQMIDTITKSVREVHLTVSWKEGNIVESIDLVTHVVSMGPGSDRNVWNAGGIAGMGAPGTPGAAWVRQQDGRPVPNPIQGPNGTMVDPADNSPAIPASQWAAQQGAAAGVPPQMMNPMGGVPSPNSFVPFGTGRMPFIPPGGLK